MNHETAPTLNPTKSSPACSAYEYAGYEITKTASNSAYTVRALGGIPRATLEHAARHIDAISARPAPRVRYEELRGPQSASMRASARRYASRRMTARNRA